MQLNFFITAAIAALVPIFVGFLWYNPKTLGNAWMASTGLDEHKAKLGFNPLLVFGLTYLFSFFLATALAGMCIHQMGFYQMLQNHFTEEATKKLFSDTLAIYGNDFRTFKHGALHGTIAGITFALPVIAVNALFERKSFKYIFINAGFWIVCCMLMAGIMCQFADISGF